MGIQAKQKLWDSEIWALLNEEEIGQIFKQQIARTALVNFLSLAKHALSMA